MKPPFTPGERVTMRRKSGETRDGIVVNASATSDACNWSNHWDESVTVKFDGAPEELRRFERQDGAGKWRTAKGHNKYTCSIFRARTTETTTP